jgi:hypothetical protein
VAGLKDEGRGRIPKPSIESIYKSPFLISDVAYSSRVAGGHISKLMQELSSTVVDIDRVKTLRKKKALGYVPLIKISR